mmetsp:Transcript_12357/g.49791  ORF Transcript_12357/g.49791 Transcript_12357/m.49791 type:complete len:259 (+) Transcript_12357:1290-2066(+)
MPPSSSRPGTLVPTNSQTDSLRRGSRGHTVGDHGGGRTAGDLAGTTLPRGGGRERASTSRTETPGRERHSENSTATSVRRDEVVRVVAVGVVSRDEAVFDPPREALLSDRPTRGGGCPRGGRFGLGAPIGEEGAVEGALEDADFAADDAARDAQRRVAIRRVEGARVHRGRDEAIRRADDLGDGGDVAVVEGGESAQRLGQQVGRRLEALDLAADLLERDDEAVRAGEEPLAVLAVDDEGVVEVESDPRRRERRAEER